MDDVTIVLAFHLVAVVLWIGGVAMFTTVLLPAVRQFKTPEEWVAFFELVERRFARRTGLTTLIAGVSGFYTVYRLNLPPTAHIQSDRSLRDKCLNDCFGSKAAT